MPITHVNIDFSKPEYYPKRFPKERLVLLDLFTPNNKLSEVGQYFRELDAAHRFSAKMLFRLPSDIQARKILTDDILGSEVKRQSISVLQLKKKDKRYEMISGPIRGTNTFKANHLKELRATELMSFLNWHRCIVEEPDAHFILPSGMHADRFVDFTNLMRERLAVYRIADWIFPYLTPQTAILADHPVLLPLLMHVTNKAYLDYGWEIPFDTLKEYPADLFEIEKATKLIHHRVPYRLKLLALLSVNSSGRLAKLMRLASKTEIEIVSLCTTGKASSQVDDFFCVVPVLRWRVVDNKCKMCGSLNKIVIDRTTYEMRPQAKTQRIMVTWKEAEKNHSFWEAATKVDAVRLHVDVEYKEQRNNAIREPRHHSIYIDCGRLITNDWFRKRCIDVLRSYKAPELVLIPKHSNSGAVASLITDAFSNRGNTPCFMVFPDDIKDVLQTVHKPKRILIADDGIVTGATVLSFKHTIYHILQNRGAHCPVETFAMIARPENHDIEQQIQLPFREFAQTHFHVGYTICLPSGNECPWCVERDLLRRFQHEIKGGASKVINERIDDLIGELKSPLIRSNNPNAMRLDLRTIESAFGNLDVKSAFASATNVAHEISLRIEKESGPFTKVTINVPKLIDAFFEAILLSALLRTFQKRELRLVEQETIIAKTINGYPSLHAYPGSVAELGWAAVLGKLPPKAVQHKLDRLKKQNPVAEMMTQLIELNKAS